MPAKATKAAIAEFNLGDALLTSFDTNNKICVFMVEGIDPAVWNAEPPNGKGRSIAAIVSHMHNVRVMWLKAAAKGSKIPDQLDRFTVTPAQAIKALNASAAALREVIANSLATDGRIKGFKPDVAGFVGYLIAHDAHHRGQVTMLARQLGKPISQKTMFGMWEWGSRGKA
jgi:uncharacterized damage-inducible protein DinB